MSSLPNQLSIYHKTVQPKFIGTSKGLIFIYLLSFLHKVSQWDHLQEVSKKYHIKESIIKESKIMGDSTYSSHQNHQ